VAKEGLEDVGEVEGCDGREGVVSGAGIEEGSLKEKFGAGPLRGACQK
jgi:hypothetical protein